MAAGTVACEVALIVAIAVACGIGYHLAVYGEIGPLPTFCAVGGLAALLYVLPFVSQGDYRLTSFIDRRGAGRVVLRWHGALLLIGVVGFLTKTTAMFSRGWMLLFYGCALAALLVLERGLARLVRIWLGEGRLATRRFMLAGTSDAIAAFWLRRRSGPSFEEFVSVTRLPSAGANDRAASRAAFEASLTHARLFNVEAVLILPDGLDASLIGEAAEIYASLPVSLHLDAGAPLDNVPLTEIGRIGNTAALTLADRPLGPLQALVKRSFDILAALAGLVLLAPLFLLVAAAIKLESRGPVLFLQQRRGYNQRVFRIVKFRSMTTLDDGDHVVQAKICDPRITRVGRILRRYNIDELPQLWNVLVGEMSLVGPRPHAVAHDKQFETRIGRYPRRLNVKPGITGWAQVNGLRGETETDDKMARRVEYDLYYIDHWSIWLDLYIVALTVLSRRAFVNAR